MVISFLPYPLKNVTYKSVAITERHSRVYIIQAVATILLLHVAVNRRQFSEFTLRQKQMPVPRKKQSSMQKDVQTNQFMLSQ